MDRDAVDTVSDGVPESEPDHRTTSEVVEWPIPPLTCPINDMDQHGAHPGTVWGV